MRVPRQAWALPAIAAALVCACREDLPPFEANDRPPVDSSAVRLTSSPNDDRSPAWSANGDTLFFSAEGTGELSGNPGVLLAVPRLSGAARIALETIQSPNAREIPWLVTPAADPTSPRLAFIEIVRLWDPHACSLDLTRLVCAPELDEPSARRPPLHLVTLHIRGRAASGPLDEDTALELRLAGVELQSEGGVNTSIVHNYPFQQVFTQETGYSFRASWAPDGERVAVSDGLRILIWRVGQAADTVPGTADGVWPSWSPAGEWIAFTRLERADSSFATCDYIGGLGVPACTQVRTDYLPGRRILTIVRADGSGLTELGEGEEAAWAPDGGALFFRRDDRIWHSAPDGTNAVAIPRTEGGREPAVSPDGRYLAIAKRVAEGNHDIWILALEP